MAIAFDTATNGGNSSVGTTLTFSHTCTGSNLRLYVMATGDNTGSATDDITGATYNGVAMTLMNKTFVAADRYRYLFRLINPATGANSVVITSSTSGGFKSGNSESYTGCDQTTASDVNAVNQTTATTVTVTLTTLVNNSWTVLAGGVGGASATAGTGSTIRATSTASQMFDSNGAIASAGSTSMTINTSDASSHPIMGVMAAFGPFVTPTTNSGFFAAVS